MNEYLFEILEQYEKFPQVKAIALGGSSAAESSDYASDIDVYVFVTEDIPIFEREKIVKNISSKYEIGGEYFGAGDEFFVDKLQKQLDVMFWSTEWFENTVNNVWEKFYPSNGYTTCFLYTLDICSIIYDRDNLLQNLKNKLNTVYPGELQKNIIKRNMMLLKDKPFASYYEQIEKALKRKDFTSVNHRLAAFLASYFDIIFALNKMLHPGEKRLVSYCKKHCKILPEKFEENINNLLDGSNHHILNILDEMTENLRKIISCYSV